jgi:predicted transcriptional regulator
MATEANIRLPDDLLAQAESLAQAEGITADAFVAEATKKQVARKLIEKLKREAQPSGMTEDEEMEVVNKAVHDYRRGR